MKYLRASRVSAALMGALVLSTIMATPALAYPGPDAETTLPTALAETKQDEHCWTELGTGRSACAASQSDLAQLVSDEYGVTFRVTNTAEASEATQLLVSESLTASQDSFAPAATWVLGIFYELKNFTGRTMTITTTISHPCDGSAVFVGGLYDIPWYHLMHDNLESLEVSPGCEVNLWADAGGGGSSTGYIGTRADVGILRNLISSYKFRG